ncbi:MAG: metallophosphoesterase [Planctomycetes bacterium]|nr:metallophosphoesterase [Planctomycetota bacterium]
MKIGIIADTHDNITAVKKAVSFFNKQNLEYVIHAGDYIAPFSLRELMNVKARFIGVFGNNDGEQKGLLDVCKNIHIPPYTIVLDGKTILLTHILENICGNADEENVDIIISAHTHTPKIKQGMPLYINPGECCGWLSGKSTVALMNLKTLEAEIIDLSTVS